MQCINFCRPFPTVGLFLFLLANPTQLLTIMMALEIMPLVDYRISHALLSVRAFSALPTYHSLCRSLTATSRRCESSSWRLWRWSPIFPFPLISSSPGRMSHAFQHSTFQTPASHAVFQRRHSFMTRRKILLFSGLMMRLRPGAYARQLLQLFPTLLIWNSLLMRIHLQ